MCVLAINNKLSFVMQKHDGIGLLAEFKFLILVGNFDARVTYTIILICSFFVFVKCNLCMQFYCYPVIAIYFALML